MYYICPQITKKHSNDENYAYNIGTCSASNDSGRICAGER